MLIKNIYSSLNSSEMQFHDFSDAISFPHQWNFEIEFGCSKWQFESDIHNNFLHQNNVFKGFFSRHKNASNQ